MQFVRISQERTFYAAARYRWLVADQIVFDINLSFFCGAGRVCCRGGSEHPDSDFKRIPRQQCRTSAKRKKIGKY
jgi:hypothetical protein